MFELLEAAEREQIDVLHEVHKATRSGDEDVTAHLELLALVLGRRTTVNGTRSQHGTVTQAAGLEFGRTKLVYVWKAKSTVKVYAVFDVLLCTRKIQRMPLDCFIVLG